MGTKYVGRKMGRAHTTTSSSVTAEVNMSIDVELTDLAYGGDAVGRYEGRVLFVPGGIPGERVRVDIVEERRGHARAALRFRVPPWTLPASSVRTARCTGSSSGLSSHSTQTRAR